MRCNTLAFSFIGATPSKALLDVWERLGLRGAFLSPRYSLFKNGVHLQGYTLNIPTELPWEPFYNTLKESKTATWVASEVVKQDVPVPDEGKMNLASPRSPAKSQEAMIFHFQVKPLYYEKELEELLEGMERRGARYRHLGDGKYLLTVTIDIPWVPFYQTIRDCASVTLTDFTYSTGGPCSREKQEVSSL